MVMATKKYIYTSSQMKKRWGNENIFVLEF